MNKTKELFKWPMLLIGMCCAIVFLVGWLTLLNISASLNHNYVLKDSGVTKNLTIEYKENKYYADYSVYVAGNLSESESFKKECLIENNNVYILTTDGENTAKTLFGTITNKRFISTSDEMFVCFSTIRLEVILATCFGLSVAGMIAALVIIENDKKLAKLKSIA
ncbi:MAG: hypothetical protein K6F08_01540 [bacterium]|nr:hypothetical protein [bacterium]